MPRNRGRPRGYWACGNRACNGSAVMNRSVTYAPASVVAVVVASVVAMVCAIVAIATVFLGLARRQVAVAPTFLFSFVPAGMIVAIAIMVTEIVAAHLAVT